MSKVGATGDTWDNVDHASFQELAANKGGTTRRVANHCDRVRLTSPALGDGPVMVIPVPEFTDRVRHGMDVLDQVAPGWTDQIDVATLDLWNPRRCVLGQAWPHYQRLAGLARHVIPTCGAMDCQVEGDNGFQLMPQALIPGDRVAQAEWVSSIGCTITEDDCQLANVTAKNLAHSMFGETESTMARKAASSLATEVVQVYFEELTRTWLREISSARHNGRWSIPAVSLPSQPSLFRGPRGRVRELLRV